MTSIEKRLTDALAPIGWEIAVTVYKGAADRYLVIRHGDHPISHGDDRPGALRILVYVDIYCPLDFNPVATVNAVRRALFNAGCTYPTTEDASDDDCRHIVVECEAIGSTELTEPTPGTPAASESPTEGEGSDPATGDSPTPSAGDQTSNETSNTTEETVPTPSPWDETGNSSGGTSRWG